MKLFKRNKPRSPQDPDEKAQRAVKIRVWAILGAALLSPLALLMAFAAMGSAQSSSTPAPKYRGVAQTVASDWMAGRPIGIPVQAGVTVADVGSVTASTVTTIAGATTTITSTQPGIAWDHADVSVTSTSRVEIHWLAVRTVSRRMWMTVTITQQGGGPVLAANPALTPAATGVAGDKNPVSPDVLYASASPSKATNDQITAWAKAYVENDQRALYLVTGDTRTATYAGLGGFTFKSAAVSTAGMRSKGEMVASVTVSMLDGTRSVITTYDLLISNFDKALPNIVAWGPAGSAATLAAYQNAQITSTAPSGQATTTTTTQVSGSTSTTKTTASTPPAATPAAPPAQAPAGGLN
jgi:hypothetical protein